MSRNTITFLQSLFGQRRVLLDVGEVAESIGWNPQSIRNGLSDGSFPLKGIKIKQSKNSPSYFYIEDVADLIDKQRRDIGAAAGEAA